MTALRILSADGRVLAQLHPELVAEYVERHEDAVAVIDRRGVLLRYRAVDGGGAVSLARAERAVMAAVSNGC